MAVKVLTPAERGMLNRFYRKFGLKNCGGCDTTKDVSEFSKNSSKGEGLQSKCRDCKSAAAKQWQSDNRERHLERKRQHYAANREQERERDASRRQGGRPEDQPWPDNPDLGYHGAHRRVHRTYGPASAGTCDWDGCEAQADSWAYNHACPNEMSGPKEDSRAGTVKTVYWSPDPRMYRRLCQPHHISFDLSVAKQREADQPVLLDVPA